MKFVSAVARILMAVGFLVAGANHVHSFFPQQPLPPGLPGQFTGAMMDSGFLAVVGVCEVIPALLLLANRFVPLALVLLAPILFNILVIDTLIMRMALPIGFLFVVFWCLAAWPVRSAFLPLLRPKVSA